MDRGGRGIKERVDSEWITRISVASKISNPTFFVPKYVIVIVKGDVMLPGLLLYNLLLSFSFY